MAGLSVRALNFGPVVSYLVAGLPGFKPEFFGSEPNVIITILQAYIQLVAPHGTAPCCLPCKGNILLFYQGAKRITQRVIPTPSGLTRLPDKLKSLLIVTS